MRLERSLELQWVPFISPGPLQRDLWALVMTIIRVDTHVAATPHVTGLCLYLIALENIKTTKGVRGRLLGLAQSGKIGGVPGDTSNSFAYNGIQQGGSELLGEEPAPAEGREPGEQQIEEEA